MTPDAIRQLDGPALTTLAFYLGLAPADVGMIPFDDDGILIVREPETTEWEPHVRVDQAYVIFRRLRDFGFCTHIHAYPTDPPAGSVRAWRYTDAETFVAHFGATAEEECLALLRVACLAVARLSQAEYT